MQRPIVYIAGPMVFRPDAQPLFARLKAICAEHGLEGLSPLDPPFWPEGLAGTDLALAIRNANMAKIRQSQGVVACISPFRGPGADAGTAWEMGFAEALGLPVTAWTEAAGDYAARARKGADAQGQPVDEAGWMVEDFGLSDNLMLAVGLPVFTDFALAAAALRRLVA